MQPESLPRREDSPRWLLLSLVILLLIGSGAALSWLATSERADRVFGNPSMLGDERVITRLEQIFEEPARRNLVGRDVQIQSVAVQDSVGDYTFWIGQGEASPIPVILIDRLGGARAREKMPHVRDGSVVTIFGTVRATRPEGVFKNDPGLADEQLAALRSAEVYIAAETALVEGEPTKASDEPVSMADAEELKRIDRVVDEGGTVTLTGRQVTIRGAGVQSVVGNYTFWIGPDEVSRIPVVLVGEMTDRQPEVATIVRNGDSVTVFGVIRNTGPGHLFERDPLVDGEERSELSATDTYIAATQVLFHD